MPANQNNQDMHVYQTEKEVLALREVLKEAKTSENADRIHASLIAVLDGLITQAQKQARLIESLRSDLTHKQGIVTNIDGSAF